MNETTGQVTVEDYYKYADEFVDIVEEWVEVPAEYRKNLLEELGTRLYIREQKEKQIVASIISRIEKANGPKELSEEARKIGAISVGWRHPGVAEELSLIKQEYGLGEADGK